MDLMPGLKGDQIINNNEDTLASALYNVAQNHLTYQADLLKISSGFFDLGLAARFNNQHWDLRIEKAVCSCTVEEGVHIHLPAYYEQAKRIQDHAQMRYTLETTVITQASLLISESTRLGLAKYRNN